MARYFTGLIVAIMLLYLILPLQAQGGVCPDYTTTLQTPHNTYPGPGRFCATNSSHQETVNDPALPCNSGIRFTDDWPIMLNYEELLFVTPASQTFPTGYASVSFALTVNWAVPGVRPVPQVIIRSHGAANQYLDYRKYNSPYGYEDLDLDQTVYYFSTVTGDMRDIGDNTPINDHIEFEQGGLLKFILHYPSPNLINNYAISSVRVIDSYYTVPAMCGSIPVPTFTPTPTATGTEEPTATLTPSPSPTGTYSPTATTPPGTATNTATPTYTMTPYPTSSEITITPRPSNTPYAPIEVSPESTSTRLPVLSLPTISFSAVSVPSVPEISTPQPFNVQLTPFATDQITRSTQIIEGMGAIATRWITTTNDALGWLSPDITNTTGISTPVQIAGVMAQNVAQPFQYIRALRVYMPNIWPYLLVIFLLFIWIFFNLLVKFGLAIISELLDVFRRVIELIPFVE